MSPAEDAPGLRALVRAAAAVLTDAGVPSPAADAAALAEHILGVDRLVLVLAPPLPPDFTARYAEAVERRRHREPLQHITGRTYFRHLQLQVRPGVFIPRPETEVVAERAITAARAAQQAGRRPLVVDLCCGAGPIALSVAAEAPGARVVAVDAEPAAVELTRQNAARADLPVQVQRGDVRDATLLTHLDGQVDVLVANPPYIPPDAVPRQPEVRDHDPDLALYGGGRDGLEIPRAVIEAAQRLLRPGGAFIMEHAEVQGDAARQVVHDTGAFTEVSTAADLSGRSRMVLARRQ